MDKRDPLTACEELSMLSVGQELSWMMGPFLARAEAICKQQKLPSWKIHSIATTLQMNFVREVNDGLSEAEAIQNIDRENRVSFGKCAEK